MLFRPRLLPGAIIASLVTAAVFAAAGYLALLVGAAPITFQSFLGGLGALAMLVLGGIFVSWTVSFWTLRYQMDRNALTIRSAFTREFVPLGSIQRVVPGEQVPWVGPVRGLRWFGYFDGRALVENLGYAVYRCAYPTRSRLLYIVTPGAVFAVSPKDAPRFAKELRLRLDLGPTKPVGTGRQSWWLLRLPFWQDRTVLVLAMLAFLVTVANFGMIAQAFPSLPELLSLHFTAQGIVDRVGFREELLKFPAMALIVLVSNWTLGLVFHARERMVTYLLLVGALAVQVLFAVAVVRIIY